METKALVIFDYSGTLSTQTPLFALPEHLHGRLVESGLAKYHVEDSDTFWREIVNPTWGEGSTTAIGYVRLLEKQLRKRLDKNGCTGADDRAIHQAAACFVRSYLAYSVIDPRWIPLLQWLSALTEVITVIATDHYAEATDAILVHLRDRNTEGAALRDGIRNDRQGGVIIVANSADLGVHKTDRAFWEIVRTHLSLTMIRRVLLVDDFGALEQTGDAYGLPDRISRRRQRTLEALQSVFQVPVTTVDFVPGIPGPTKANGDGLDDLIEGAIRKIRAFLTGNDESSQRPSDQ